jgi:hypothetical protein
LIVNYLNFLIELTVENLRLVYHDFDDIYKRHVDGAKFDALKGHDFVSLKERLITVRHLLEKCPELVPGKRTELIKAVLSEDNLQRVQQIFPKPDKNNQSGKTSSLFSMLTGFFSGSKETDEESLRKELKKIISGVSDSNFLLQLKGIDDKELETPIQAAMDLACGQLSSSIDATVRKMTHAVLRMQQEECRKSMQHDVETEKRKVLGGILLDFIRDVNKVSAGRRTS